MVGNQSKNDERAVKVEAKDEEEKEAEVKLEHAD